MLYFTKSAKKKVGFVGERIFTLADLQVYKIYETTEKTKVCYKRRAFY
jgi:hypothetical protein